MRARGLGGEAGGCPLSPVGDGRQASPRVVTPGHRMRQSRDTHRQRFERRLRCHCSPLPGRPRLLAAPPPQPSPPASPLGAFPCPEAPGQRPHRTPERPWEAELLPAMPPPQDTWRLLVACLIVRLGVLLAPSVWRQGGCSAPLPRSAVPRTRPPHTEIQFETVQLCPFSGNLALTTFRVFSRYLHSNTGVLCPDPPIGPETITYSFNKPLLGRTLYTPGQRSPPTFVDPSVSWGRRIC